MTIMDSHLNITNCTFENNSALLDGGVMYLICNSSIVNCSYNIEDSNFTNNSAGVEGGVIKYDYY
jgi:predicted outer membrane repeat protein